MVFSLFFLFLSMLTHSISTTTLTAIATTTTTTLDVASTIQKTLDLLNPALRQEQPEKTRNENTLSSLSFTIHPRSSLHRNQHHHDYESLTLARLARDSHRVALLIRKLNRAISRTNKSVIKLGVETNSMTKVEDLTTPVTSGLSEGTGEYFARVGLGTPVQSYYLVIDTGSDITWLQCLQCSDCYKQINPIYDPSGSSSYNALPCNSQQCELLGNLECQSGQCLYHVSYGDGSSTLGDLVTETVSFGSSGSIPSVAIGCGHNNTGFIGSAGILGLGSGPLSFLSQIKATSFSYCLADRYSSKAFTLDFNSTPLANSIIITLLQNPSVKTFYYVGLTGISVGKQPLPIPSSTFAIDDSGSGGVIIDSGTTVTWLPSQAYNALRDTFTQQATNLKLTDGFSGYDTCFDLSAVTSVDVPTVAFIFDGGKTLSLEASNYLIPVDSSGKFCLAFHPTTESLSIIGNIQQQGMRVSYDISNSIVSFSPDNC